MIWLSWRQQRTETIVTAAILALLAVAFVPEGIHLTNLFVQQHVARCINRQTEACGFVVGNFTAKAGTLQALFDGGWFNLIPGLIGVARARQQPVAGDDLLDRAGQLRPSGREDHEVVTDPLEVGEDVG